VTQTFDSDPHIRYLIVTHRYDDDTHVMMTNIILCIMMTHRHIKVTNRHRDGCTENAAVTLHTLMLSLADVAGGSWMKCKTRLQLQQIPMCSNGAYRRHTTGHQP